jgi:adenylate kinase
MNLVLFGPPGIGKGTQSVLLCERLGLTHVSTGDLLRAALKSGSEVGREAKRYLDAGQLVPGPVVRRLAEDRLAELGVEDFVLDGYPRTIEQAEWLTGFLDRHDTGLDAVVSLRGAEDVIVDRLSQRRLDPVTGQTYHLAYNPPPPGVPLTRLVQRPDDTPGVIRERLAVYARETAPVEAYFAAQGRHFVVDGVGEVEAVYERILEVLRTVAPDRVAA